MNTFTTRSTPGRSFTTSSSCSSSVARIHAHITPPCTRSTPRRSTSVHPCTWRPNSRTASSCHQSLAANAQAGATPSGSDHKRSHSTSSHSHQHISSPSAQQKLDIIYLSQTPTIHPFPFVICIFRSEDGWRSGIDSPHQLHQVSHFEAHEPRRSYDFSFTTRRRSYFNIGP